MTYFVVREIIARLSASKRCLKNISFQILLINSQNNETLFKIDLKIVDLKLDILFLFVFPVELKRLQVKNVPN